VIGTGLPASPGAASGEIVFDPPTRPRSAKARAQGHPGARRNQPGRHSRHACREGILTTRGGMTSHAAVVARGMGKPCVSGAGSIRIDYGASTMSVGRVTLKKGDIITIDGSQGR
jgi:pyruvate,orthophosphate dikinase